MFVPCPACGSAETPAFFEAASVPVFCNVLWDGAEEARTAPRGSIRLRACGRCRLVFNGAFDPALLEYGPRYENSLHYSPRFRAFADALARRLVERFDLQDETVLEVGCGQADFLALLCRLGGNHGVGFDQSFDAGAGHPDPAPGTLRVETAPFPDAAEGLRPALTLCRHVLEHIPEPRPFVEAMVSVAGRRAHGGIYVEVPDVLYTLRDLGIWDVIYEHCAYYSPDSLPRLLAGAGVSVSSVRSAYGGQFLCVEGTVQAGEAVPPTGEVGDVEEWEALLSAFADHQAAEIAEWSARLTDARSRGERWALWGAGSKGVTFLNMVEGTEAIAHVVDLNPRKHGLFTAGTGHRIEAPAALADDPPTSVLVMNPLYVDEIREQLSELGLAPSVVQVQR